MIELSSYGKSSLFKMTIGQPSNGKKSVNANSVPACQSALQPKNILVLSMPGIGDALTSMTLAYNLHRAGHLVSLMSTSLVSLSDWFPNVSILPYPEPSQWIDTLNQFDIFTGDLKTNRPYEKTFRIERFPHSKMYVKSDCDKKKTVVENMAIMAEQKFNVCTPVLENGIKLPQSLHMLKKCKHKDRVLINPLSGNPEKDWSAEQFIALAKRVAQLNLNPVFCVAPNCHANWKQYLNNKFDLPFFSTLAEFAAYLYESGFIISNDSGPGHLASCLGIPSLSIFSSNDRIRFWRPGWGRNISINPSPWLLPRPFRYLWWRKRLSVSKALRGFKKLQKL